MLDANSELDTVKAPKFAMLL